MTMGIYMDESINKLWKVYLTLILYQHQNTIQIITYQSDNILLMID